MSWTPRTGGIFTCSWEWVGFNLNVGSPLFRMPWCTCGAESHTPSGMTDNDFQDCFHLGLLSCLRKCCLETHVITAEESVWCWERKLPSDPLIPQVWKMGHISYLALKCPQLIQGLEEYVEWWGKAVCFCFCCFVVLCFLWPPSVLTSFLGQVIWSVTSVGVCAKLCGVKCDLKS